MNSILFAWFSCIAIQKMPDILKMEKAFLDEMRTFSMQTFDFPQNLLNCIWKEKTQAGFICIYNPELDAISISFRSTKSILDCIYDFDIRLYPWPFSCRECKRAVLPISQLFNARVHNGFLSKYNHIRQDLHECIDRYSGKRVIFTGHSLGGAIAQIAALDIAMLFDIEIDVVTFGSPKVGTRSFTRLLEENVKITRIAHPKDFITAFPLHSRYIHAGGNPMSNLKSIQVIAYNIFLFLSTGQHHGLFHRRYIYHDYLQRKFIHGI